MRVCGAGLVNATAVGLSAHRYVAYFGRYWLACGTAVSVRVRACLPQDLLERMVVSGREVVERPAPPPARTRCISTFSEPSSTCPAAKSRVPAADCVRMCTRWGRCGAARRRCSARRRPPMTLKP